MRAGVIISALSHVVLVVLALFGTPKLFDETASSSITVDIVRPEEIEPPPKPPEKEQPPEKDKQAEWNPLPQKSEPQTAPTAPEPQQQPQPQAKQQTSATQPATPTQPTPTQQQAAGPQVPSPTPQQPPSIFDPVNIPALLSLPSAPDRGFDSESTSLANLSDDERTAFKAHLKKCWKLPAGVAPNQTTRVVLRVYLQRNGALANEPQLIAGPASRDGPLLMQAAIRSLKECQPFGFLPAEKYREWRMLDLSFSPRDMAGG